MKDNRELAKKVIKIVYIEEREREREKQDLPVGIEGSSDLLNTVNSSL